MCAGRSVPSCHSLLKRMAKCCGTFSLRAAITVEHRMTMLSPTGIWEPMRVRQEEGGGPQEHRDVEYRRALMRLRQGDSEVACSKLMERTNLGGRVLFEHFLDERLDEFNVDKWNLGVDHLPLTFEFR